MIKDIFLSTFSFLTFMLITSNSFAFSSVVYNSDCVHGNNKIKSADRDVPKFEVLDVSGAFNVTVVAGKSKQTVKITGDENLLPHIRTSVQGNKLSIYPVKPICTENDLNIDITVAVLQGLVSSGSDEIKVSGINSSGFSILQSGSGDIELGGRTRKFDVQISGAGDLEAQNLKSEKTSLNLTGSSNANVHASEELKVNITGVAEVNYFGNPKKVIKDIVGVGDVNKMD